MKSPGRLNIKKRWRALSGTCGLFGMKNRDSFNVIDVRSGSDYTKGHIEDAINIPLETLRSKIIELNKEDAIVVHCNKGTTGNAAQNILINNGFKNVLNLSGGYSQFKIQSENKKTG